MENPFCSPEPIDPEEIFIRERQIEKDQDDMPIMILTIFLVGILFTGIIYHELQIIEQRQKTQATSQ